MEAFSLLKYWRGGGRGGSGGGGAALSVTTDGNACVNLRSSTTIVTAAVSHHEEDDNSDDGPFFDLEFTLPDEEENEDDGEGQVEIEENDNDDGNIINCAEDNDDEEKVENTDSDGENEDGKLEFTLSSASSDISTDPNVTLSPSDDLFFKGSLVPLSEPNCKSQFPVSLLKSATKATKFRVLMLKLKKSKGNVPEKSKSDESASKNPKQQCEKEEKQESKSQGKFFTVNFKVEEVPIMSLFSRDNSSKNANNKTQKQSIHESAADESRFSKDMMERYLKKVKPLYVRVSKRYGQKLGFSGQLSLSGEMKPGVTPPADQKSPQPAKTETGSPNVSEAPPPSNIKRQKQGSIPAGLRVVRKHLVKSRSASEAVVASPVASNRRDDSLLQQQDGIQSAIMHCKKSFIASRDLGLSRSVSDPLHDKSVNVTPNSSLKDELKQLKIPELEFSAGSLSLEEKSA